MAHTHEFDCRQCGAHLDSREELAQHNRENHTQQAGSSGSDASNRNASNASADQAAQGGFSKDNIGA